MNLRKHAPVEIHIYRRLLLVLLAVMGLSTSTAFSNVSGVVVDENSQAIAGAYASLMQLPDSTVLESTTTDDDGSMSFTTTLPDNDYLLFVKAIGCGAEYRYCRDGDKLSVTLKHDGTTVLDELTVSVGKPEMRRDFDRYIFVPNGLSKLVPDCYSLIGMSPLIYKIGNDYRFIDGGTPIIKLNGKEPIMGQELVREYLASLEPWRIRKIELYPSKSFASEPHVINVILDRPEDGIYGSVAAEYKYFDGYSSGNGTVNIWTNHDRLQFSASGNFGHEEYAVKSTETIKYYEPQSEYISSSRLVNIQDRYNATIAAEYAISNHSSIGLNFKTSDNDWRTHTRAKTIFTSNNSSSEDESASYNNSPWHVPMMTTAVRYQNKLDDLGSKLETSVNYGYNNNKSTNGVEGGANSSSTEYKYIESAIGANAMYSKYIKSAMGFAIGFDYTHGATDYQESGIDANRFKYRENMYNLVVAYGQGFTNWFVLNLSLDTQIHQNSINNVTNRMKNDAAYFHMLPHLNTTFMLPKASQTIEIDYSTQVNMPTYFMLNPFERRSAANHVSVGNINLKPTYMHDFSIMYNWRYCLTVSAGMSLSNNAINDVSIVEPDGTVRRTYANVGRYRDYYIRVNFKKLFFNRWYLSAAAIGNLVKNRAFYGTDLSYKRAVGTFMIGNTISVWPSQNLNVNANFSINSGNQDLLGRQRWSYTSSISVNKTWGNSWTTTLLLENPIASKSDVKLSTDDFSRQVRVITQPMRVSLNIRYTFGSRTVKRLDDSAKSSLEQRTGQPDSKM